MNITPHSAKPLHSLRSCLAAFGATAAARPAGSQNEALCLAPLHGCTPWLVLAHGFGQALRAAWHTQRHDQGYSARSFVACGRASPSVRRNARARRTATTKTVSSPCSTSRHVCPRSAGTSHHATASQANDARSFVACRRASPSVGRLRRRQRHPNINRVCQAVQGMNPPCTALASVSSSSPSRPSPAGAARPGRNRWHGSATENAAKRKTLHRFSCRPAFLQVVANCGHLPAAARPETAHRRQKVKMPGC